MGDNRIAKQKHQILPGEIAAVICLEAEYMYFTKGILFINHSPSQKTVPPTHDEANIPTKNMKASDVTNPRPVPGIARLQKSIRQTKSIHI